MAATPVSPHPLHLLLPRLGTDEEFAALRALFLSCGFNDEGICRRLEIPSIVEFKGKCEGRKTATVIQEPIDVLIRLLLDGEFVAQAVIESRLPAGGLAAMERLQILARVPERPDELFATISVYPAAGNLLLAGDRPGTPDGSRYWLPPDVVYPGVMENTRNFVAGLPQTSCEALLDLGTGSGVAALAASQYARHVWGTDIAPRSVRFADFNRRLNGLTNVTMVAGDLYEAVQDLTFDRIVTHPPYVPSPKTELIFRDGGEDGEQILRRIVEGLPRYLRPGGRFYTLVLGADCEGETFEERLRKWLGPSQAEFDLVMVSHSLRPPADFVANSLAKGKIKLQDLKFWIDTWARRKVQFLFYGSILIRRHATARQPVTARVQRGSAFRPEHQDWLLDWEAECKEPAALTLLLDSRPAIAPGTELHVLHRLNEGRFAPEAFGIETKEPFTTDVRCSRWLISVISACDGARTWREHFEQAKTGGLVSQETTPEEFAALLGTLVSQGVLTIAERPMPAVVAGMP
jgi:SAM-dependent methyltransferase